MEPTAKPAEQNNFSWVNPTKELIQASTPLTQSVINAFSQRGQQERQLKAEQSQFEQWAQNVPMVQTVQKNPIPTAVTVGAIILGGP
jgi:hypothetical protein